MLIGNRAGALVRGRARERTAAALRAPEVLAVAVAIVVVVVAIVVGDDRLTALTGHPWSRTTYGFVLGAAVVSCPWAMWTAIIQTDGSWSWRVGAQAERWTANVLRRLGAQWRFEYNVVFYGGKIDHPTWVSDIDCVAVGPGGVFAVSTKWTADAWNLDDPGDDWLVAAARQAERNAYRLARELRAKVPGVRVVPVVVCWGPHIPPTEAVRSLVRVERSTLDDVWILHGCKGAEWLPLLSGLCLSDEQISAVHTVVNKRTTGYVERSGRTSQAQASARKLARWSRLAVWVSAGMTVIAIGGLVGAAANESLLHGLGHVVGADHGVGGAVYVLLPAALLVTATVLADRARRRSARARVRQELGWERWIPPAALAAWVVGLIVLSMTA